MRNIIIITGGSNGLGKAIAEYSLKNNLIVYNLDKENLELNNENYKFSDLLKELIQIDL